MSVVSDSVWPHKRQPNRLPRPWDSPDKNTGVGCHFLLQCMKVKSESEVAQSCPTPSDPMDCSAPGSSVHGIFQARVLEWGAIAFSKSGLNPRSNTWWRKGDASQMGGDLLLYCSLSYINRHTHASTVPWERLFLSKSAYNTQPVRE